MFSQDKNKRIFYKNNYQLDSTDILYEMWDKIKDSLSYHKEKLMEEENLTSEEVDLFFQRIKKISENSKKNINKAAFNFFAYRQTDTVFLHNKYEGRETYLVDKFDLNSLRKHRTDSMYYNGELRIDTGSYVLNLDSSPGWVIKYDISFKEKVENILGFNCINIEITETKTPPLKFAEPPEINHFVIYATKDIRPVLPLQPLLFLQRKILEEYTPLQVAKYRNGRRLSFYRAVKIE